MKVSDLAGKVIIFSPTSGDEKVFSDPSGSIAYVESGSFLPVIFKKSFLDFRAKLKLEEYISGKKSLSVEWLKNILIQYIKSLLPETKVEPNEKLREYVTEALTNILEIQKKYEETLTKPEETLTPSSEPEKKRDFLGFMRGTWRSVSESLFLLRNKTPLTPSPGLLEANVEKFISREQENWSSDMKKTFCDYLSALNIQRTYPRLSGIAFDPLSDNLVGSFLSRLESKETWKFVFPIGVVQMNFFNKEIMDRIMKLVQKWENFKKANDGQTSRKTSR